jgi:hypothetical protein
MLFQLWRRGFWHCLAIMILDELGELGVESRGWSKSEGMDEVSDDNALVR